MSIKPNGIFDAFSSLATDCYETLHLSTIGNAVFTLAHLWEVGADEVRVHWIAAMLATGNADKGKEV